MDVVRSRSLFNCFVLIGNFHPAIHHCCTCFRAGRDQMKTHRCNRLLRSHSASRPLEQTEINECRCHSARRIGWIGHPDEPISNLIVARFSQAWRRHRWLVNFLMNDKVVSTDHLTSASIDDVCKPVSIRLRLNNDYVISWLAPFSFRLPDPSMPIQITC